MRRLAFVLFVLVPGCSEKPETVPPSKSQDGNQPKTRQGETVPPKTRSSGSTSDEPFELGFCRGSHWHGYDTIRVHADGSTVLFRTRDDKTTSTNTSVRESTQLQLDGKSLRQLRNSIDQNRLLQMKKAYRGDMYDGTQWIFFFQQGERKQNSYFDNQFPESIKSFANDLDWILNENGLPTAAWKPEPKDSTRAPMQEFWDAIK